MTVRDRVHALRGELWDADYRPVAIHNWDSDLTTSPGKAPLGEGWQERARRDPPAAVRQIPDTRALNTGILCDGLRILDVDVEDAEIVAKVRSLAIRYLGETVVRYRENSARILLPYRAAEGEPQVIADAREEDPIAAAAEFDAEFRSDIAAFIAREVVEEAVVPRRFETPPMAASYVAFVDPSGGSADSMTLAIAHRHDGIAVLDAVREMRPPFSPEAVVSDFAALLRTYGIRRVTGDRYAGEWPRERFHRYGITYLPSERTKSDIYRDVLPVLNSGKCELLDLPRLVNQLCGLERRTARGGRDSIDHVAGQHDDVANAACGALLLASSVGRMGRVIPLSY